MKFRHSKALTAALCAVALLAFAPQAQAAAFTGTAMHAPGGIVSLVLLFFFLLLGVGCASTKSCRKGGCAAGTVLYFLAVLLAAWLGGWFAVVGLLYIGLYGIVRSVQVLRRGKGAGRVFVALLLLVLTALATADFATSRVAETVSSESQSETAAAITALKTVASAEKAIHSAPELPGHPANSYAGIDFLLKYRLVDKGFAGGVARNGYTFHLAAPADGQKFLVWAVPANYKGKKHDVREWIPGASLYGFFNPVNKAITEPGGVMSLSLDETGTLRGADLGGKADASAEEAAAWPEYKR